MATKEKIDQMGVSFNDDGDLIVRYLDAEGNRTETNLTAFINAIAIAKANEAIEAHLKQLHGHQV